MTAMDERNPSRRLGGLALAGLWLVVAAAAVGVGFGAVRMVGAEVTDPVTSPLSAGRVATSPTPGTSPTPATSPTPVPSAPAGRGTATPAHTRPAEDRTPTSPVRAGTSTRTVRVTGGTVAVRCTGDSASLLYARPDDGYVTTVKSRGPAEVEVEFRSSGGDGRGRVKARCSGGTASVEARDR
jgi:hypothetical protein